MNVAPTISHDSPQRDAVISALKELPPLSLMSVPALAQRVLGCSHHLLEAKIQGTSLPKYHAHTISEVMVYLKVSYTKGSNIIT